jgi:hypothetical protein
MRRPTLVLLITLASLACRRPSASDPTWVGGIEAARANRLAELTADEGWLTLVARHVLSPGENVVGSDPAAAIALEAPGIPPRACAFDLRPDGSVLLRAEPGAPVSLNGLPPADRPLVPEGNGRHDVVTVGRVRITMFEKNGRLAVRARDPESPRRKSFGGLAYFPIDPAFRVDGELEPYAKPAQIDVPTSHGPPARALAPGLVRFRIRGVEYTLEPTVDSDTDETLFFVFADATSGEETYGAGRFLRTERPKAGETRVLLDFNLAENPPCSLTPYASCPMALPRNTLPVRIEAGERIPGGD